MVDKKRSKEETFPSENQQVSAVPKPAINPEQQRTARLNRIAEKLSRDAGFFASIKAALQDLRHGRVRRTEELERDFLIPQKGLKAQ
jgi:hypothetical protein